MSTKLKIHKVCPSWGETNCKLDWMFGRKIKNIKTTTDWRHVTCSKCLKQRKQTKPKILIGYKAVNKHGDNLYSWSSPKMMTYKLNTWISRPIGCGPLTVFKSKPMAVDFVEEHSNFNPHCAIYKCKYIQSKDRALWMYESKKDPEMCPFPKGTVLADKVKLLK